MVLVALQYRRSVAGNCPNMAGPASPPPSCNHRKIIAPDSPGSFHDSPARPDNPPSGLCDAAKATAAPVRPRSRRRAGFGIRGFRGCPMKPDSTFAGHALVSQRGARRKGRRRDGGGRCCHPCDQPGAQPERLAQWRRAWPARTGMAAFRGGRPAARERGPADRGFRHRAPGPDYPATPGDMACSLSHQRLWQAIAAGPAEAAVVLEDDARLAEGFADFADEAVVARMLSAHHGGAEAGVLARPAAKPAPAAWSGAGRAAAGSVLYRMRSTFLGSCGLCR